MKHPIISVGVMILIVAGAAAVRLSHLGNRPMHTDEAVHAAKFGALLERGEYAYDAHEFHGPSLNYLTIPIARLGGAETLAQTTEFHLRVLPAICGIMLVAGLWLLRDALGCGAVLCGALLTAISPSMIFYSRYYIQEMLLVCFTFFAVAALWRAAKCGAITRIAWLVLGGACVGL
ncbi:MAG: phospholipid carrier-dependent glycosyltransferase, partial [bacterium]|nr:phospholipid carrier-dependent glycosyltransferase [bacterium]